MKIIPYGGLACPQTTFEIIMEYYTEKSKLILTEYGRNIQQMVEYAMTIEDRAERQRCVNTIINVMGNLFPHLRDVNDFKHKLWDHLAMMSNYQLDIDYPYDVPKAREHTVPDKLPYPSPTLRNRHYGRFLQQFINVASAYEGPDKIRFITIIANQAKKSYLLWNGESVSDKKILDDLRELSGGKLQFSDDEIKLRDSRELLYSPQKNKNYTKQKSRSNYNYKYKQQ